MFLNCVNNVDLKKQDEQIQEARRKNAIKKAEKAAAKAAKAESKAGSAAASLNEKQTGSLGGGSDSFERGSGNNTRMFESMPSPLKKYFPGRVFTFLDQHSKGIDLSDKDSSNSAEFPGDSSTLQTVAESTSSFQGESKCVKCGQSIPLSVLTKNKNTSLAVPSPPRTKLYAPMLDEVSTSLNEGEECQATPEPSTEMDVLLCSQCSSIKRGVQRRASTGSGDCVAILDDRPESQDIVEEVSTRAPRRVSMTANNSMDVDTVLGQNGYDFDNTNPNIIYQGPYNAAGKRHGHGGMTWSNNGNVYVGDFYNGYRHGKGTLYYGGGSGAEYSGEWRHNKMHGTGTRKWPNGDKYCGDYVNGERSGKGRFDFANGDMYIGSFYAHKMHGFGRYHYKNGQSFEGHFSCGKRHGKGKLRRVDGSVDIGLYCKDVRVGTGVRFSADYTQAWKLNDGKVIEPIAVVEAAKIESEMDED